MTNYVDFDHYYDIPIIENFEKNYEEYGRKLREILLEKTTYGQTVITNEDIIEALKARHTDYIQSRIINLGLNLLKNETKNDEDEAIVIDSSLCSEIELNEDADYYIDELLSASEKLLTMLNQLLNLDQETINIIHLLTLKICEAYLKGTTKPSQGEKNLIKSLAREKKHKCYICSREVDLDNISSKEDRKKCEIEHIFPRVYGGSRNKVNLTVCCENCNKIKGENITHNSINFESFITSSNKEENIRSVFTKDMKLSLIMKQNLRCIRCEERFFKINDLEAMYAVKKDKYDIFHYFNTGICCNNCFNTHNLKGVRFELQL